MNTPVPQKPVPTAASCGPLPRVWLLFTLGSVALLGMSLAGCTLSAKVHGLEPEYPPARWHIWAMRPAFMDVDSLQPTLRWEAFPRPFDREHDDLGILPRTSHISYDLKIWEAEDDYPGVFISSGRGIATWIAGNTSPGKPIYARVALPLPSHGVEIPLKPSTKYFWTVRARFLVDGHPRVTEWSRQLIETGPGFGPLVFYRFETPGSSEKNKSATPTE